MTIGSIDSPGIARRLRRLVDEQGVLVGVAIDHRDSLRAAVRNVVGDRDVADGVLRSLKTRITRALTPDATAIMLDHELGDEALAAVPANVGVVIPLEEQGYEHERDDRVTALMAGFGPQGAQRLGADACKILLPYRPDREAAARKQEATVRETSAACHTAGMPVVVEAVPYPLEREADTEFRERFPALVAESIERLRDLGADVFKLPFPTMEMVANNGEAAEHARRRCEQVTEAVGDAPWVLLGGAASPDEFEARLRIAVGAGAIGFLVGRPLWGPALSDVHGLVDEAALKSCASTFQRWNIIVHEARARPLVKR